THQYIGEQTRIAVLSKNQPQPKKETVYKTVVEWKLDCDVCGTGLTATPEDIGSQKRCPDCHKVHTIVAPTRMPAPVQRIVQDELEELNSPQTTGQQIVSTKQVLSEIPDMRDKIQRDEFAASRKILEKAQQQQNKRNEEEEKLQHHGNSWGNSLTQLVTSPTTLARITLLTIGYAITAALFSLSLNSIAGDSGSETKADKDINTAVKSDLAEEFDFETSLKQPASSIKAVGALLLFIAALVVFLVVNLAGLSTLMNILRQTIVGDLQISDWPPFSITGWASDAFTLFAAFIYSLIPSGIVFTLLDFILANSLIPTMLSSIAMVLLFPFFLLNILASGSVLLPISTTFIKKLKYQSDLLVKFLFFTTLAIITNIMGFNLLTSKSLLMAMIGGGLVWLGYVVLVRNVGFLVFNLTADDN
ncbi:MAG: hypothetical protein VX776_06265, partial [Planctomycetota bacterium]|nr:hypothetical protein [Planctomycetota bacterium]